MDNPQVKSKNTPTKRKRCEKGTRRNPKTGKCEPVKKDSKEVELTNLENQEKRLLADRLIDDILLDDTELRNQMKESVVMSNKQPAPAVAAAAEQAQAVAEPAAASAAQSAAESDSESESDNDDLITSINRKLNERELRERRELKGDNNYDFLYPILNDANFNIKIAQRKEFNDTKYDGDIIPDIEKHSDKLCNSEFELAPHQLFVRNFLSFQTPYNSLLLYHGLGSGKTCSAISVAEEMRDYMINIGIINQIMIVASPNVQENFRVQLFDESKLKLVDGLWNIRSCTGNKFLKEINPMNMKGLSRENVVRQINRLIDTYYQFFGYLEFANYISKKSNIEGDGIVIRDEKHKQKVIQKKLRKVFSGRLCIIDEIHNIRVTDDNKDKRVADELLKLVKNVNNIRLLLLSGTPMFNSYKEIIWLINLMNINDRRSTIEIKDVFNKDGSFIKGSSTDKYKEGGQELLERKATGYISVVRGENPYTFPYRVWPTDFANENTFAVKDYPTIQLNGTTELTQKIQYLSLFLTEIGEYQQKGYNYILERIKGGHIGTNKQMPTIENIETYGYTLLTQPLESLNIIYPHEDLDKENKNLNSIELVGSEGLKRIMNFTVDPNTYFRSNFNYKPEIVETYGRIFSPEVIGNYSSKIKTICNHIINSKGVVLVYSQYIDAGLVPLALALEEHGFSRAGNSGSLFSSNPTNKKGKSANYIMITGDKSFSPNPANDIKLATNDNNINGDSVKVILISQTGTEGLDLKFIRQVHVMEPWYNMNRIEQIFGRAIRTCSHKLLPFNERNVELYLYASLMRDNGMEETADLYIYRLAEIKALQIGKVSRVLKEISVDCILNSGQTNFTEENMELNGVKPITLELSSGLKLENYKIGDKPYSSICDYMEDCEYTCRPTKEFNAEEISLSSYAEDFIMTNTDKIIYRIKQLFKERYFYTIRNLIASLNSAKVYPDDQIFASLEHLIEDKNEFLIDKYGRMGHLINIDDLYLFQPLELNDERISIFERSVPLDVKHHTIIMKMPLEKKPQELYKTQLGDVDETVNVQLGDNAEPRDASVKPRDDTVQPGDGNKRTQNSNAIEINNLVEKIEEQYNLAINKQITTSSEKNWYLLCWNSMEKMTDVDEKTKHYLIVQHIIDDLNFKEIMIVMNVFYDNPLNNEKYKKEDLFKHIKTYIREKIIVGKNNINGLLLQEKSTQITIVTTSKNKDKGKWHIAEAEDEKDLKEVIEMKKRNIMSHLNNVIGFMGNFKKEDYVVFKLKNTLNERDLGLRCDQLSSKTRGFELLYTITGNEKYRKEHMDIPLKLICIIQELYLRLFERDRKNKKIWFLNPAESVLTNIDKKTKKEKGKKKTEKK
jgi:hypothetical protein